MLLVGWQYRKVLDCRIWRPEAAGLQAPPLMHAARNVDVQTAPALLPSIPAYPLKKASIVEVSEVHWKERSMSQELSRETEAREYVYCLERREGEEREGERNGGERKVVRS